MKKINKCLCILISVLMITSLVSFVGVASDYENHWAKDAILSLINAEVISGDFDGNLRPDDKILRAEYVKVINRYFGYKDIASENFPDVDNSKWYADEFLIAKKAGYITGDEFGNANPEAYITRAEVCVILSRILNLNENNTVSFSDDANIPSWAKGCIGAMVENGYITGYSDGTVRAYNNITRAEAFSLVSRVPSTGDNKENENKTDETTPIADTQVNSAGNISSMVSVNVSTGGGGGGGGSSSRPTPMPGSNTTPSVAQISLRNFSKTDYSLEFDTVNAASVTVKIEIKNDSYSDEFVISNEVVSNVFSGNLMNNLETVLSQRLSEDDIYVISAKANAKSGYTDSSYINVAEFSYKFDKMKQPEVTTNIDYENKKVTASWTPDSEVPSYEVKVYDNDVDITNETYVDKSEISEGKVTVNFTGELMAFFGTNYKFEVIAKGQGLIKDSSAVVALADPAMVKLDDPVLSEPVIDYTENKITVTWNVDNKATSYAVKVFAGDEEVTEGIDTSTSGKVIISAVDKDYFYSNTYKVTVTAVGNLSEQLDNSNEVYVTQDNTVITGTGTDIDPYIIRSGVQFAKIFKDNQDEHLTNSSGKYYKQANDIALNNYTPSSVAFNGTYDGDGYNITIKSYISTGDKIQGLIAQISSSSIIKNLTLSGTIDATGYEQVGGIVGYCTGSIIKCVNKANITGKAYIGGIAGRIQSGGKLINCVNAGTITATNSYVGGIAGDAESGDNFITNCANYGDVYANSSSARVFNGGILGRARGVTIEKCFNAGTVTKAGTTGALSAIVGSNNSKACTIIIKDCFNIGVLKGGEVRNLVYAAFTESTVNFTVENFYDIKNTGLSLTPADTSGLTVTKKGNLLVLGDDVLKETIINAYSTNDDYECTQDDGYDYPNFKVKDNDNDDITDDITVVYNPNYLSQN